MTTVILPNIYYNKTHFIKLSSNVCIISMHIFTSISIIQLFIHYPNRMFAQVMYCDKDFDIDYFISL